ncbi:hypothetical protein ACQY0O_005567 [Thecaphora frezii]
MRLPLSFSGVYVAVALLLVVSGALPAHAAPILGFGAVVDLYDRLKTNIRGYFGKGMSSATMDRQAHRHPDRFQKDTYLQYLKLEKTKPNAPAPTEVERRLARFWKQGERFLVYTDPDLANLKVELDAFEVTLAEQYGRISALLPENKSRIEANEYVWNKAPVKLEIYVKARDQLVNHYSSAEGNRLSKDEQEVFEAYRQYQLEQLQAMKDVFSRLQFQVNKSQKESNPNYYKVLNDQPSTLDAAPGRATDDLGHVLNADTGRTSAAHASNSNAP